MRLAGIRIVILAALQRIAQAWRDRYGPMLIEAMYVAGSSDVQLVK